MGESLSPEHFSMPDALVQKISEWHDYHNTHATPWDRDDSFDYEASDAKGLAVAKDVKLFVGFATSSIIRSAKSR